MPYFGPHAGRHVALLSYRLGMADGVSVTATQWATALRRLGARVTTVAGEGLADVIVPELAVDAPVPPARGRLAAVLDDADLVVADNVCSLPMNRAVGEAVAEYLVGRPAVLRHHDLPWERAQYAGVTSWPHDDPAWRHVTISELARRDLAARRGITATTVYHGFDEQPCPARRAAVRAELGVTGPLVLQPTRAIARKNVDVGLALARALGATFWLTGPAEDGYADRLEQLVRDADVPVRRGLPAGVPVAAANAACDVVALPSSWEGFGLPLVESALHRRPLVVGEFPVARELGALGFRWFNPADHDALRDWLADPDPALLDHNEAVARRHFGMDALVRRLDRLLSGSSMCHHARVPDQDGAGEGKLTGCDCLTV
ncbi:MAG: mannosylglucosylglycerate synthase [Pseudonocardiales bacterium]|nr:mannosylglucosylglycerate synthase [Pseudonocardiales bacterium]